MPPDVLSNLPDNVIDAILNRLPCKDVVRTSILATKWRYCWCRLPTLALDASVWRTPEDLLDPSVKFTKIIYQILTHQEGPITSFVLNIRHLERCPNFDSFLYFLSRNGIQHLVLDLSWNEVYKLPSSLFSCSQLRHLNLDHCLIHPPSSFKGFDRLISLKLSYVTISAQFLGSLISQCPLLEQLVLEFFVDSDLIEINAPMLRYFEFIGSITSICLQNVPCLAKASLRLWGGFDADARTFNYAKFLQPCSSLEDLFFDFVYSKPYDRDDDDDDATDIEESLQFKCFSDVTFNHLKEVKLIGFSGTMPQLHLAKLLLAKSPAFVKILILQHSGRSEVPSMISTFCRTSPNVEVVYKSVSSAEICRQSELYS